MKNFYLSTVLSGNGRSLLLKNPIMTASGTFGYGLEFTPFGELESLGAIVVKGLSLAPRQGNNMPRLAETASGMLNAVGLQNCGVQTFIKEKMPLLRKLNATVIANLYGTTIDEFAELGRILADQEDISGVEINISCPNVKEGGIAFGQDPIMTAKVTEAVVKSAPTLPIIVKLSPNVTDITQIAKACEEAGATCVSCINTVKSMAIDLKNRKPYLANTFGGLSGPAIKPIALRCVWEVAQSVSIPVIGLGGISCVEDVLEFILAGASAVQIGTANFMSPDIAFSLVKKLPSAIEKYRIENINDFRGSLIIE